MSSAELQIDEKELPDDPKPKLGIPAAERKAILALLPRDIQDATQPAVDAVSGASVADALVSGRHQQTCCGPHSKHNTAACWALKNAHEETLNVKVLSSWRYQSEMIFSS
eukprot:scaffold232109_cov17-Prasinocladus_malaysianus.AAC.1